MKHILTILIFLISIITYSQTRQDFIGTWEYEDGNNIFRVIFFEDTYTYQGVTRSITSGHFSLLQTDASGNETILYTSDRTIGPNTTQRWSPAINGGGILRGVFNFSLYDNTNQHLSRGNLDLKFLDTPVGEPLQISWKLRFGGIYSEGEEFNAPRDLILTKVN